MGLTHVTVTLRALEKSRKKYEAPFLVDTKAINCMAPAPELHRAGIRARGRMNYETGQGSTLSCEFGLAVIEFMGELTFGRVLFGPDDCEPLLGMTALASVGIVIDPITGEPKRVRAIPLKRALPAVAA